MTIFRVQHDKDNPYLVINTTIATDDNLSWKAKGIWLYAFSRKDDWKFYKNDLLKRSTDGERSLDSGLKELEDNGYLHRQRVRNEETGQYIGWDWIFYETPRTKEENSKNVSETYVLPVSAKCTPIVSNDSSSNIYNVSETDPNKEKEPISQETSIKDFAPRCEVAKKSYEAIKEAFPTIRNASASVIAHKHSYTMIQCAIENTKKAFNLTNPIGFFRSQLQSLQQASSETPIRQCSSKNKSFGRSRVEQAAELGDYAEGLEYKDATPMTKKFIIKCVKTFGYETTLDAVKLANEYGRCYIGEKLDLNKILEKKINECRSF